MKNYEISFENCTVTLSASFLRKASTLGTKEYKQTASMIADVPSITDVPDRPYFVNQPVEEEEEEVIRVAKSKPEPVKPAPVAKPVKLSTSIPQRPYAVPITPSYRPAYIPPTPAQQVPKKEMPQMDLSRVVPGVAVKHKAFGVGTVKALTKGKDGTSYIVVTFGTSDKQFAFPGAFYQGFLSV